MVPIILLANVFETLYNKGIEIYELDPAYFFVSTLISMASMSEEYRRKIGIVDRFQYWLNGRKMYQRWNVSSK